MGGFSVTAYAGGDDYSYWDEPEETPAPEPTPEPQPLTPDGNMTLVDDIEGDAAEDKQFITVVTKTAITFTSSLTAPMKAKIRCIFEPSGRSRFAFAYGGRRERRPRRLQLH